MTDCAPCFGRVLRPFRSRPWWSRPAVPFSRRAEGSFQLLGKRSWPFRWPGSTLERQIVESRSATLRAALLPAPLGRIGPYGLPRIDRVQPRPTGLRSNSIASFGWSRSPWESSRRPLAGWSVIRGWAARLRRRALGYRHKRGTRRVRRASLSALPCVACPIVGRPTIRRSPTSRSPRSRRWRGCARRPMPPFHPVPRPKTLPRRRRRAFRHGNGRPPAASLPARDGRRPIRRADDDHSLRL